MVDFVIRASTPEDFQREIVNHLKHLHKLAQVHANFKNQSARTRLSWQARTEVLDEAISFIEKIKIAKETP